MKGHGNSTSIVVSVSLSCARLQIQVVHELSFLIALKRPIHMPKAPGYAQWMTQT